MHCLLKSIPWQSISPIESDLLEKIIVTYEFTNWDKYIVAIAVRHTGSWNSDISLENKFSLTLVWMSCTDFNFLPT